MVKKTNPKNSPEAVEEQTPPEEELLEADLEEEQDPSSSEATIPLDQHQRLLAEFDNYRKRVERERQRADLWTRAEVLAELLPILDDFERAKNALGPEETSFDRDGMLIIMDRLAEALNRAGLRSVEASPGQGFDPEIHEAVFTVPSAEIPSGCVADVLEQGYRVGERLLRPAKVAVVQAPAKAPEEA